MPGLGHAFVQYTTVLEAAGAARALRLKTFNERQVQVDYYPLALYLKEVGVREWIECRTMERWANWCNFIECVCWIIILFLRFWVLISLWRLRLKSTRVLYSNM